MAAAGPGNHSCGSRRSCRARSFPRRSRTALRCPAAGWDHPSPARPLPPHQVLALRSPPTCTGSLSHPGSPALSKAGPPASCWPPGPGTWPPGRPWADPSPPQHQTLRPGRRAGREGKCYSRPGRAQRTDVEGAWASQPLRTPCRLSRDPSPGQEQPEPRSAGSLGQPTRKRRPRRQRVPGQKQEEPVPPPALGQAWEATGSASPLSGRPGT